MNVLEFYNFESEFYDALYSSFIDDLLFIKKYGFEPPYCEFFSGTGRISSLLKQSCGVEISKNMIRKGFRKYDAIMGDVRYAPLRTAFKSVIIPLNSLNLLGHEDRILVLNEARRILLNGGKIYVEVINGLPFALNNEFEISSGLIGNDVVNAYLTVIEEGGEYFFKYRYEFKGENKIMKLKIYPLTFDEFLNEVGKAHLVIENVYGGYDFQEFDEKSDRIIAVLVK